MTAQKKKRPPLLLPGLAALLLALLLGLSGGLDRIDDRLGDTLLALEARGRPAPADILLVTIDQKSLEDPRMARDAGSWPWPRAVHAELIANLQAQEPAAIAFDILFNEADSFRPDSDEALRAVAAGQGNLFFPSLLMASGRQAPLAALPPSFRARQSASADPEATATLLVPGVLAPENWQGGLINFEKEADGIGRYGRLFTPIRGWQLPSFSASVARFTGTALPATERVRLHWYGEPPRAIPYADLFHDLGREAPTLAAQVKDRIVIIGATAPGLHDLRPTPLSTLTPGVEVLTTTIANLRDGDWLRDWPARWPLALLLIAGLLLAFWRHANPLLSGAALLLASLAAVAAHYVLLGYNAYAPVGAALVLAWLTWVLFSAEAYWNERRARMATVGLFSRFLDPRVVADLVKSGELQNNQKPESRTVTVLFSDIRGFTTLSETRTPEAVVELLNHYFSQQVEVVFRHGGTLDKFIGDAIMAFWNAPTEDRLHAAHAVQAAIGMGQALDRFRAELALQDPSLGHFDIGIGVHTGPAVVGFLGSEDRLDYTAIGDTVNLASRIEGATKGVSRVLVSEATRDLCEREAPGRYRFIDHGEFHVKGRDQGVRLFEPREKDE